MVEERIDEAFMAMPREHFLPPAALGKTKADAPIGIGYGQTNSQPSTVRKMLVWLDMREGQKALDVGSGSGWTTALLSYLVGPRGMVFAVERIPELLAFGEKNCERAGVKNALFSAAGGIFGLPDHAPFDRILVSASATGLPEELVAQLKLGGKMVIPVKNDILEIIKSETGELTTVQHGGFTFVPLI